MSTTGNDRHLCDAVRADVSDFRGTVPQPTKHRWEKGDELTSCKVCGAAYRHRYSKGMPDKSQDRECWKFFPPAMDRSTNESAYICYVALKRLGDKRDMEEVQGYAIALGFPHRALQPGVWHLVNCGVVDLDRTWLASIPPEAAA